MTTQEERLNNAEFNLRQFKTETIKAYQDMAFEMTVIKGLTEDAIKRLATLNSTIEKRFDNVDQRFNQLETKFDEHTTLLTQILAHLPKQEP